MKNGLAPIYEHPYRGLSFILHITNQTLSFLTNDYKRMNAVLIFNTMKLQAKRMSVRNNILAIGTAYLPTIFYQFSLYSTMSNTFITIAKRSIYGFACLILAGICLSAQIVHADDGPKPAVIIDVRTPAEYEAGHIIGAINIPVERIGEDIHSVSGIDKHSSILLYCRSGVRSAKAQNILQQQGYTRVVNGGGLSDMIRKFPACSYSNC